MAGQDFFFVNIGGLLESVVLNLSFRVRSNAMFTSAGPFVISLFLFVKIDLATDSGSEYDRDKKKIGFHFFLHV